MKTIKNVFCTDLIIYNSKRAPIEPSNRINSCPLDLVHMDILGPEKSKSIWARSYALGSMDFFKADSEVLFLKSRGQVYEYMRVSVLVDERGGSNSGLLGGRITRINFKILENSEFYWAITADTGRNPAKMPKQNYLQINCNFLKVCKVKGN